VSGKEIYDYQATSANLINLFRLEAAVTLQSSADLGILLFVIL